jgi:hypothetical protein
MYQEGAPEKSWTREEASELLNTLEVKTVQTKAQRDRITEDSMKLCQEGIERVQRVKKKNSISSSEIREVSKEETYRVTEHSVAWQGVLEQKSPRGCLYLFEG